MTSRSRRDTVVFKQAFTLGAIGRDLAAGSYEIVTDEDMIEGLSFASFRRVSTMMMVPAIAPRGAMEMIAIDPAELAAAQAKDQANNPTKDAVHG